VTTSRSVLSVEDVRPNWCKSCLKAGCTACRAVEGGEDCAFCEDGELCPTRQRIAERAKAANISVAAIRTAKAKEPKQEKTKEKVMAEKLCKCGCGEALSEGAVREYKNGHKPKAETKSGGASSASPSAERVVKQRKQKAAKKKDGGREVELPNSNKNAIAGVNSVATIVVKETSLDRWWAAMTAQQKADTFNAWMGAGQ
jgi:hypothetical protein